MTSKLQITLIIITILFFVILLRIIRKSKLSTDLATVWVLFALGLIIISVFPQVIYKLSSFVGVISYMNGLFLFMLFILFCLVFYLFLKVSNLEEKNKRLVQQISINEHERKKK